MAGERVTLQDVADRAGVGVATVDRVLNARAKVRERTAARVLAAAEELGFYAQATLRRRLAEMAPKKRLGFVLQKQSKSFYRAMAEEIARAAADLRGIRAAVETVFVESLAPEGLKDAILGAAERADAIAVVSVDHPFVTEAIKACHDRGVPVFAMLSPLGAPGLTGYVGIDGRKAGRTAGWAMARLAPPDAEIGILVGSHRYLGHEALEVGFRSYMREYRPAARFRDSLVYLDDKAVAYEAASALLHKCPGMTGLYNCGGGAAGVIRALEEAGQAQDVAFICHDKSPAAIAGLASGAVDLIVTRPLKPLAAHVTRAMESALLGREPDCTPLDFRILTPENL